MRGTGSSNRQSSSSSRPGSSSANANGGRANDSSGRNAPSVPKPINLPSIKRDSSGVGSASGIGGNSSSLGSSSGPGRVLFSQKVGGSQSSASASSSPTAPVNKWNVPLRATTKETSESPTENNNNNNVSGKSQPTAPAQKKPTSTATLPLFGTQESSWIDADDEMDFSAKPVFLDAFNPESATAASSSTQPQTSVQQSQSPANSPAAVVSIMKRTQEVVPSSSGRNDNYERNDNNGSNNNNTGRNNVSPSRPTTITRKPVGNLTVEDDGSNGHEAPLLAWEPTEETIRDSGAGYKKSNTFNPMRILKRDNRESSGEKPIVNNQERREKTLADKSSNSSLSSSKGSMRQGRGTASPGPFNRNRSSSPSISMSGEAKPSNSPRSSPRVKPVDILSSNESPTSLTNNNSSYQSPIGSGARFRDVIIRIPGTKSFESPVTVKVQVDQKNRILPPGLNLNQMKSLSSSSAPVTPVSHFSSEPNASTSAATAQVVGFSFHSHSSTLVPHRNPINYEKLIVKLPEKFLSLSLPNSPVVFTSKSIEADPKNGKR